MKRTLLMTILAGTTLVVSGCAVYPEQDSYYDPPIVRVAPPPPLVEVVGPPPVLDYVWIGGYWNWIGTRYVWVPGRWEAPKPGYVWIPHRWERHGDHWRPYGGRWEPERHLHIVPPPIIEHRPPLAPQPLRLEPRPFSGVMPRPTERPEPPRIEPESRRVWSVTTVLATCAGKSDTRTGAGVIAMATAVRTFVKVSAPDHSAGGSSSPSSWILRVSVLRPMPNSCAASARRPPVTASARRISVASKA